MLRRTISGLCFFLLLAGLMAHAGQFLAAPQYTTGTTPQAVVMGDFNGDGKLDAAVANTGSNTVSILLGNGDGTFKAKVDYATGAGPIGIAAGDFNGDGKVDLAVTNSTANTVSILLGNGDGSFQAKVDIATGNDPQGVAVGDFNADGNPDLVVTNYTDGTVSVLLGNGNGTFHAQVTYLTGFGPISVVIGDFNNDGAQDLAVANKNTNDLISLLINKNNGTGTFNNQLQVAVGGMPVSIAAADFDGDGNLDLAVADQAGTVSVLLGKGTGGFQASVEYNTAAFTLNGAEYNTSVSTGDFNGDGISDLAVASGNGNTVGLLLGSSAVRGTFAAVVKYGTGATPYSVVVGDLNGDSKSDIVVANSGAASISALIGNGDGSFQTRIDFNSGPQPNAVVVADFNGDGNPDLAFADGDCSVCKPNSISVVLGNSDGTFRAPNTFATGISTIDTNTYALISADFNGDGFKDIAAVNNGTNTVSILLGNGDGTFQAHVDYAVGNGPASVAYGDFNGDGKVDLVVANSGSNSLSVLIGNGDGTFKPAVSYAVGHGPYAVARANFNADNIVDLVAVNQTDNTVSVLLGNGDGTFQAQTTYSTGTATSPTSVAIGDFNKDGKLDLAVADSGVSKVSILLGNGDGSFQAVTQYPTGAIPFAVVAGDFNGDGNTDLALSSPAKTGSALNLVSLMFGNGDGTFGAATLFPTGAQAVAEAQSIAAADFNNDGALDLVVANGLSSTVSVLLNTAGTSMNLTPSAGNPSYGTPVTLTANVAPSVAGAGTVTGTVTFENGSTVIGSPVTIVNGTASITTSTLPVGADTISAIYSGNFQSHTANAPVNVSQAGTTTTLLALSPANLGQSVTFTATVCPGAGCPATAAAPTGTVTFLDGATAIGTGTVASNGNATFTTSSLAAGTHSITASYPGDTNYIASVSPAGSQLINGPAFGLAASALSPASVAAGSTSTSTITITPTGGLSASSVSLSCAVSSTVSKAPTCSVGAISGTTATLTVSTTAATTAMAAHHSSFIYAMWFLLPAMVFGSVFVPRAKRSQLMMFGAVLLISAGCIFQSACGGGSPKTTTTTTVAGTPSGSYSVTVTGTATGAANQTAGPLTLTVQ